MLTINVLYALPKTPLWDRLAREGRISERGGRESNVASACPTATVLGMWRKLHRAAYAPRRSTRRYAHQQRAHVPEPARYPMDPRRLVPRNVRRGLGIFARLFWRLGVRGDYRADFWRVAARTLRARPLRGDGPGAVVSHHLIEFTRQCLAGMPEASFYAPKLRLRPEEVSS